MDDIDNWNSTGTREKVLWRIWL